METRVSEFRGMMGLGMNMCDICGYDGFHNLPIHRLHDRISKLEELARPAPQPAQESLATPSLSLGDYERVLAPLRAEVVSASKRIATTPIGRHSTIARSPTFTR